MKDASATTFVFPTSHDQVTRSHYFRNLNHSAEEFIDLLFAVAEITTFDVMGRLLAPATGRCVQLN